MMKCLSYILLFFFCAFVSSAWAQNTLAKKIDSLLAAESSSPFNGVIFISQKGKTIYRKACGFSDLENKTPLKLSDQFVIGSISKQFTAVLVLQEMERHHLNLDDPIGKYILGMPSDWSDKVTIHHLLTHTHGIAAIDQPLTFVSGSQFAYSQLGYELLSKIVEKTSGQSFALLSAALFEKCGMKNTFHPGLKEHKHLVKAYTRQQDGSLKPETESFENYVAAGSFISNAADLSLWNNHLFSGKLLTEQTLGMMLSAQHNALRMHPLFGATKYGYGITVDIEHQLVQCGQTGFCPGFASMNFFLPESATEVIMLGNTVCYFSDMIDFKNVFYYHTAVLKAVKDSVRK